MRGEGAEGRAKSARDLSDRDEEDGAASGGPRRIANSLVAHK